jgi:hypothetical protein
MGPRKRGRSLPAPAGLPAAGGDLSSLPASPNKFHSPPIDSEKKASQGSGFLSRPPREPLDKNFPIALNLAASQISLRRAHAWR